MVEVQEKSKSPLKAITFTNLESAKDIRISAKKAFRTSDGEAAYTIESVSFPVLVKAGTIGVADDSVHHGRLGPVNVATKSILEKLDLKIKPRNSGPGSIGKKPAFLLACLSSLSPSI